MGIWDIIAGPLLKIIDKVIPDPAAKAQAQLALMQAQQAGDFKVLDVAVQEAAAQAAANQKEAESSSVFVAGWRPMIGWVCAVALGCQYIVKPLVMWGFSLLHYPIPVLPGLDDNLWQLMMGMLGLGSLRTYEKLKGVASK